MESATFHYQVANILGFVDWMICVATIHFVEEVRKPKTKSKQMNTAYAPVKLHFQKQEVAGFGQWGRC